MVNIIIPRYKPDGRKEYLLSAPQMILAAGYVVMQIVFSILVIYKSIASAYLALIISVVIMIVYLALNFTAAEKPEEIDVRRAEEAKQRAEERLRQKQSIHEYYHSRAALARAMARLKATSGK